MKLSKIFQSSQTVFDLKDLGILLGEDNYNNLKSKIAYYVKQGYLHRIRKGIFVKQYFDKRELACKIYSPSYISFETILSQHNLIYQFDATIYVASYLTRAILLSHGDNIIRIQYRKIKDEILFDQTGVVHDSYYSYASAQRAIADMRYLQPNFYFDHLPDGFETP